MRDILLLVVLALALGCSEKRPSRESPPTEADLPSAPRLTFGPRVLPPFLAGVELGMSSAELRAARPRAYPSRPSPQVLHEEIAKDLSAHYTLGPKGLASVLVRKTGGFREEPGLLHEAKRRFGKATRWGAATWFVGPGMIIRIEVDLGNLILEVSADSIRKKAK